MIRCLTCGSLMWESVIQFICPRCTHSGVDSDPEDGE